MRRKVLFWIFVGIGFWLLLIIYGLVAVVDHGFEEGEVHTAFIIVYTIIAIVATSVLSATSITSEKEANSWEILLCTPLGGWHIALGKAVGIIRRCLPLWLLPIGHMLLFQAVLLIHPALLSQLPLVVVAVMGLLAGSGLYFGTLFKRTTTAVIMNLALAIALWAALPGFLALAAEALPGDSPGRELRHLTEYVVDANPVYQAGLITDRASGGGRAGKSLGDLNYHWAGMGASDFADTTAYLALLTTGYLAIGLLFAWRAKCRIRRTFV
jgi:ABC-type transport system involved in multi-copper enzyme maturation permease subunit